MNQSSSKAEDYIRSKGWNYRDNGDQLTLEYCLYCNAENYHFYIAKGGKKDGLFDCKKCGACGNLWKLMEDQGDRQTGVQSQRDWAGVDREQIPNVESCARALVADETAMDYLIADRGWSLDTISKQKLGMFEKDGKKWLIIPYLQNGNVTYAKYRTLPPAKKEFDAPKGWDAPLYNQQAIVKGMPELMFVEGEPDALALLSQGINYVVGVPGANTKKTLWVTMVDGAAPEKIYILYDNDSVGQKAAREMAKKLGIEKCWNIVLPTFEVEGDEGPRPGKDINEWFRAGHNTEDFEALKGAAVQFDVEGIYSTSNALAALEEKLSNATSLKPTYDSPWPSLNPKFGGAELGDVIDIMAAGKIGKSTMALNWLDYIVAQYNEVCMMFCLEMPQDRMARKWISHVTQTDDSPPVDEADAVKKLEAMKASIQTAKQIVASRKGDLLFGYTTPHSADEVFDIIRQAVRRYGVKWVCFDNLQLLCDLTLKNQAMRTVHLSQISKKFKSLATELGIVMLRIIQPNRPKEGEIVGARNADGSSQIEKDCDSMIVLHRNIKANVRESDFAQLGFMDEDVAFEPQMFTRVALSRYAQGGITTLWIDGARSTVREFTEKDREVTKDLVTPQTGTIVVEA